MNPIDYLGADDAGVLVIMNPEKFENAKAFLLQRRKDYLEGLNSLFDQLSKDAEASMIFDLVATTVNIAAGNTRFPFAIKDMQLFAQTCVLALVKRIPFGKALELILDNIESNIPKDLLSTIDASIVDAKQTRAKMDQAGKPGAINSVVTKH